MAWQVKISDNATVEDTVNLIRKTINEYHNSPFVVQLVQKLKSKSITKGDFFRKLFYYACENVSYKRDEKGHEKVTTPERLIQDGVGDCKKFTVFIGAALKLAGFPEVLKIVSYDGIYWAHIYIIVPYSGNKYITLDPVNQCKFNAEVKHRKAWLHSLKGKNMELSLLGNLEKKKYIQDKFNNPESRRMCKQAWHNYDRKPAVMKDRSIMGAFGEFLNEASDIAGVEPSEVLEGFNFNELQGLSGVEEDAMRSLLGLGEDDLSGQEMIWGVSEDGNFLGKRKKRKSKIWGFLKKVGLTPSRISFLGLVRINLFGLAKKLYKSWKKDNGKRLSKLWTKLGGNPKKLWKTIQGGVKRLIKKGKLHGMNGAADQSDLILAGIVETDLGAAPLAAIAAAAVPIITAVASLFKKQGDMNKNNPEDVQFAQNVDKAEAKLEQRIDSGEADKYVQQVQSDSRFQQAEGEQQPVSGEEMDLSGLGKLDWGNMVQSIAKVVKIAKPTVKAAAVAIKQVKAGGLKATNPKTKKFLVTKGNQAEALLKKQQAATNPEEKKKIGDQVVDILKDVTETVEAAAATPQKAAGSYTGGNTCEKILKLAAGVGYVQTFYGKQIIDFLTNLF